MTSVILHAEDPGGAALARLGERVRELRARRGMARRVLAADSSVSERYLAQLEAGQANASFLILRQIAAALDVPVEALVADAAPVAEEIAATIELLKTAPPGRLAEVRALLARGPAVDPAARAQRVALIGLRGAGKSTLGAIVAERLGVPFVELDREIERHAGTSLAAIFDLYGQPGFRRLEREALERILAELPRFVLATGGSIVSEPATYERLLGACRTIWLTATPAEHMRRVVAQGDMRPMAGNPESMADLERILATREPLYRRADVAVQTSGRTIDDAAAALLEAAR